jgi:glycosyltransferase involved in cell wall biosynthesis
MIKLSIIIPALNEERFLPFLLTSIKNQNFAEAEVIIADAGSTDRTLEIAARFGAKTVDGGMPAVGRNRGAEVAVGEWLLFLDSDVILPKNFLADILVRAEEKQIDVASCAVVPLSDKNIDLILHDVVNAYMSLTQYFYPHAPGFCILIKKSLHQKIGGFDKQLKLAEDHNYVKRAKQNGKFRIFHRPKVFVSVRRLEADGRLNISTKYLLCEVYRLLLGEIETDIFKYKFGHYNEKEKERFIDRIKNKLHLK